MPVLSITQLIGSSGCRDRGAARRRPRRVAPRLDDEGETDRGHQQRVLALVHQRTQNETFGAHADKDHQADGDGQRRPERQPELHEADKGQHREEHHRALREVEHRRGLVDQHETQRDQRVHRSRKQAADQNLEKKPKVRHCLSFSVGRRDRRR
jgi:hypothetical protein